MYIEGYVSQSAKTKKNALFYKFRSANYDQRIPRYAHGPKKKTNFDYFTIVTVFLRLLYRTVRRFITRRRI